MAKPKTINVITTATEFREIRNSLGASLLMMDGWNYGKDKKGVRDGGWRRKEERRWNEEERGVENVPEDGTPYRNAPARLACDLCESNNETRLHLYDNKLSLCVSLRPSSSLPHCAHAHIYLLCLCLLLKVELIEGLRLPIREVHNPLPWFSTDRETMKENLGVSFEHYYPPAFCAEDNKVEVHLWHIKHRKP